MTEEQAQQILEDLRTGTLTEYRVDKDAFTTFRLALVAQDDFKNFRGNAQHKGAIIYTYEPGWTA